MHVYGMRLRGFSIGCQPMEGLIGSKDADKRSTGYWSFLTYNRKLSDKEMKEYSLDYLGKEVGGYVVAK